MNRGRMKMKTKVVRILITLLLIYGVYTETGKWTATNLFFIMLYIEATLWKDRQK